MGLFSWIAVGMVAGWIGGMIAGRRGKGCITNLVVGVVGALIGGAIAKYLGIGRVDAFDLQSVLIASAGAALFLFALNAVEGKKS